ncbi:hypothetical protein LTR47_007398 [Exophiala xenobiotica]|nr:hypothetical protein LTR41_009784 [Exophiala xenobiotica]KAK5230544.1 hypothetical protein LTR47_007398 [Exophiala xenobiotica]KAK5248980.1 hypothetical protein LTS06_006046 [Exophiala xenobiotica]KAK5318304.1 hypothetical protein LTR93_008350 [Exophiala xenobiotica]KAK5347121.1 hypothetical protein LTR61_009286 [Exophiala xenobiotica]
MASEEAQIICAAAALGAMAATATVTAVVMAIIIDDLENDTDTSDDDSLVTYESSSSSPQSAPSGPPEPDPSVLYRPLATSFGRKTREMPATAVTRTSHRGAVSKVTSTKSRSAPPKKPILRSPEEIRVLEEQEQDQYTLNRTKQWVASLSDGKPAAATETSPLMPTSKPASSKLAQAELSSTPTKSPKQKKKPKQEEEKRLRRFRSKPPASFLIKLQRARVQRMVVLARRRVTENGAPSEHIDIVGSTGNVYEVVVCHTPTCTCPDALKGNECKHKVYALSTVLKAPEHLQYQLALLTVELEEIFANAPPIPTDIGSDEDSKGNRKPTDGECPICYMDLDPEHNKLVWCKAQCGHNLHKSCFDQWAASMAGKEVRCVYCRTPWEVDVGDSEAIKQAGEYSADGYVNVAQQFGMSRARDYTSYHQPWVRRQFGVGW